MTVGLLAPDLAISLHRSCYSFTSPFYFLLSRWLEGWYSHCVNPLLYQSFAWGFLGPLFTSLPLLGFVSQHSCCASPFHYFIHWTSSAHLLLIYLFIPMSFLLNLLDFLNPITTSLPLVTFWAYWPPSQPIKFINSFPKLPRPIYFLFTSYYSYGLATSFLELPRSIYFFFTSFYSCGPADYQSCHSSLLGLFSYFFTVFFFSPSPLLGFFYC